MTDPASIKTPIRTFKKKNAYITIDKDTGNRIDTIILQTQRVEPIKNSKADQTKEQGHPLFAPILPSVPSDVKPTLNKKRNRSKSKDIEKKKQKKNDKKNKKEKEKKKEKKVEKKKKRKGLSKDEKVADTDHNKKMLAKVGVALEVHKKKRKRQNKNETDEQAFKRLAKEEKELEIELGLSVKSTRKKKRTKTSAFLESKRNNRTNNPMIPQNDTSSIEPVNSVLPITIEFVETVEEVKKTPEQLLKDEKKEEKKRRLDNVRYEKKYRDDRIKKKRDDADRISKERKEQEIKENAKREKEEVERQFELAKSQRFYEKPLALWFANAQENGQGGYLKAPMTIDLIRNNNDMDDGIISPYNEHIRKLQQDDSDIFKRCVSKVTGELCRNHMHPHCYGCTFIGVCPSCAYKELGRLKIFGNEGHEYCSTYVFINDEKYKEYRNICHQCFMIELDILEAKANDKRKYDDTREESFVLMKEVRDLRKCNYEMEEKAMHCYEKHGTKSDCSPGKHICHIYEKKLYSDKRLKAKVQIDEDEIKQERDFQRSHICNSETCNEGNTVCKLGCLDCGYKRCPYTICEYCSITGFPCYKPGCAYEALWSNILTKAHCRFCNTGWKLGLSSCRAALVESVRPSTIYGKVNTEIEYKHVHADDPVGGRRSYPPEQKVRENETKMLPPPPPPPPQQRQAKKKLNIRVEPNRNEFKTKVVTVTQNVINTTVKNGRDDLKYELSYSDEFWKECLESCSDGGRPKPADDTKVDDDLLERPPEIIDVNGDDDSCVEDKPETTMLSYEEELRLRFIEDELNYKPITFEVIESLPHTYSFRGFYEERKWEASGTEKEEIERHNKDVKTRNDDINRDKNTKREKMKKVLIKASYIDDILCHSHLQKFRGDKSRQLESYYTRCVNNDEFRKLEAVVDFDDDEWKRIDKTRKVKLYMNRDRVYIAIALILRSLYMKGVPLIDKPMMKELLAKSLKLIGEVVSSTSISSEMIPYSQSSIPNSSSLLCNVSIGMTKFILPNEINRYKKDEVTRFNQGKRINLIRNKKLFEAPVKLKESDKFELLKSHIIHHDEKDSFDSRLLQPEPGQERKKITIQPTVHRYPARTTKKSREQKQLIQPDELSPDLASLFDVAKKLVPDHDTTEESKEEAKEEIKEEIKEEKREEKKERSEEESIEPNFRPFSHLQILEYSIGIVYLLFVKETNACPPLHNSSITFDDYRKTFVDYMNDCIIDIEPDDRKYLYATVAPGLEDIKDSHSTEEKERIKVENKKCEKEFKEMKRKMNEKYPFYLTPDRIKKFIHRTEKRISESIEFKKRHETRSIESIKSSDPHFSFDQARFIQEYCIHRPIHSEKAMIREHCLSYTQKVASMIRYVWMRLIEKDRKMYETLRITEKGLKVYEKDRLRFYGRESCPGLTLTLFQFGVRVCHIFELIIGKSFPTNSYNTSFPDMKGSRYTVELPNYESATMVDFSNFIYSKNISNVVFAIFRIALEGIEDGKRSSDFIFTNANINRELLRGAKNFNGNHLVKEIITRLGEKFLTISKDTIKEEIRRLQDLSDFIVKENLNSIHLLRKFSLEFQFHNIELLKPLVII
jgi:hypothetical protein